MGSCPPYALSSLLLRCEWAVVRRTLSPPSVLVGLCPLHALSSFGASGLVSAARSLSYPPLRSVAVSRGRPGLAMSSVPYCSCSGVGWHRWALSSPGVGLDRFCCDHRLARHNRIQHTGRHKTSLIALAITLSSRRTVVLHGGLQWQPLPALLCGYLSCKRA